MKKLLVLCLSLFTRSFGQPAKRASTSDISPIVEERNHLFTLGVLSYLYNRLESQPKPCWEIAALIAWDVENINQTPDFVIERNQNFEKQGNIFHAEIMAIEKASLKNKSLSMNSSLTREEINKRLGMTTSTIYTSLEPCPFCTMGITWSRIPKVIYFMADPSIRSESYDRVSLPSEFCGRTLTQVNPSTHPLASKINQELRDLFFQDQLQKDALAVSGGEKVRNVADYFKEHLEDLLRSGQQLFCSYEIIYDQNKDLYAKLIVATELDSDKKNHRQSYSENLQEI